MTVSAEAIARRMEVLALDRPLTERRGRSLIAELAPTKEELTTATERLAASEAAFAAYRADTAALLAALTERLETVEGLTLGD